jgi:hypothetical protein
MPLRVLHKAMEAFAAFDSVAARRACETRNAPALQLQDAGPKRGVDEHAAEGPSIKTASGR